MKSFFRYWQFLFVAISVTFISFSVKSAATDEKVNWGLNEPKDQRVINHQPWQTLLNKYLAFDQQQSMNLFSYSRVTDDDYDLLIDYIDDLQMINPLTYHRDEQMAYWVNLYNALTVLVILDNYPIDSIREIGENSAGPWDDLVIKINGIDLSLNMIEHQILRQHWQDSRIHYAVNCASIGCPDLQKQVFTRKNLDSQLTKAAKSFINHTRAVNWQQKSLILSSIFQWFLTDFGKNETALLENLALYAEPDLAKKLKQYRGNIQYQYNWQLNAH